MSAFIVDTETMDIIAGAIADDEDGQRIFRPDRCKPPVLPVSGRRHVAFLRVVGERSPAHPATAIGRALYAMNEAAIGARYGRDDEDAQPRNSREYVFMEQMPATPAGVFKALECLLYQCAEGDVPTTPLYLALERYAAHVSAEVVRATPAYNAAKWG